ncbi:Crp/Fnr family transcriptional regulator [Casimicrobium huifangae]|jgi:CRP/FNR family transcriptional regulator|uniref:Crp/Fnr family transcriptional regulator n=1 Tax=Casimicrobium huifangae TaxID=2591109 RepID=UPI0037841C3D
MPTDELIRHYPSLASADRSELDALPVASVPGGAVLFDVGQPCQGFPLVLDGEIKVSRQSSEGRSLELYRVVPGEICLVSSASLFGHKALAATGVTARASRLVLLPPPLFSSWLALPAFREAVLGLFAERMADLTTLVDAVAFRRLDQRLAAALLGRGQDVPVTHQALADELGTVREIVTRLLHRFERDGWITLSREHIHIIKSAELRALAGGG